MAFFGEIIAFVIVDIICVVVKIVWSLGVLVIGEVIIVFLAAGEAIIAVDLVVIVV